MKYEMVGNTILILQNELDIYDAPILKDKISSAAKEMGGSVIVDLHHVDCISTPIIQILLSSGKYINGFKILNISDSVNRNLSLFGYSL
ncbi:MAG: hypothetical protein A2Z47_01955 [Thermodesulfovibrio sp. RBG_19FT_COMBO_42_12]|nr:MAG: hypothetical protein A2Z47_01955 [Thermodesulfovibrio sp. RBG_19FT_COMBO_42_12]HZX49218.1 STAS domain-containing protein [Nitrospirota bacterium]